MVCLHGITAQHRAFNAVARYLEASRGLVGVDLRGRGDSDKPESGYSLEAHAADVVRVLDHLGLRERRTGRTLNGRLRSIEDGPPIPRARPRPRPARRRVAPRREPARER